MIILAIGATRRNLRAAIARAQTEPVVVERRGRPVAVMLSLERYGQLMEALEEVEDITAFDAAMAEEGPNIAWEQVRADLGE